MHEASLMLSLMRKIDTLAAEQQARQVTRVSIWLGALAHMSVDHFREHFEQVARDTIARDAKLDITLSDDIRDPEAQDLVLRSIEVET